MRIFARVWVPCVVGVVTGAVACASQSTGDAAGDGGTGGSSPTLDATADVAQDSGIAPIVITSGGSSSLPTLTVYSDGGMATLNPTEDAATMMTSPGGQTDGGGTPPPFGDASATSGDSSVVTYPTDGGYPEVDGGHHFHHDGGYERDGGFHHGSGSGSGASSGSVPTTCEQTNEAVGCCVGQVRYWCESGTVQTLDCGSQGKFCAWSSSFMNYGCLDTNTGADPSGDNPIACE